MTIWYPDRINAVIAADGAPVKQADGMYHPFYRVFYEIIKFMILLEVLRDDYDMTKPQAKKIIKEAWKEDRAVAAMLLRQMDPKDKNLKWNRNTTAMFISRLKPGNTFHFDLELRSEKDNVYHLLTENGPENWNFEVF
jgi:hypothetical protein